MPKEKKDNYPNRTDNLNVLSVKKEDRSSRFVIDLKKAAEEGEMDNENRADVYKGGDFLERLAEFNFKEFFKKGRSLKEDFQIFFNSCREDKSNIIKGAEHLVAHGKMPLETKESLIANGKLALDWFDIYSAKIEQLAVFSLAKFIIIVFSSAAKMFYKFCYRLGWIFLFLIRFFGLIFHELISLVFLAVYKFYSGVKFIGQVFYVNSGDFAKEIFGLGEKAAILLFRELRAGRNRLLPMGKMSARSPKGEKIADGQREEGGCGKKEAEQKSIISGEAKIRLNWRRSIPGFVLVLLVLVLPFKIFAYYKSFDLEELRGRILGVSEGAVSSLQEASESALTFDFNKASYNFSRAGDDFLAAQGELAEINDLIFSLARVMPNEEMKLASQSQKILAAGQIASELGKNLSLALESLFNNQNVDIPKIIGDFSDYGGLALEQAGTLKNKLAEIETSALPREHRDNFILVQKKTEVLEKGLAGLVDLMDKLEVFLGVSENKRYLLVFQNNTEMRASGGFIGSFALVDFAGGKIKNIEAPGGGSYDTEGGLRELVTAPEPLHLVNPLWHFWDANWWPDWPTSAKKLMWFYERSDGPTVDGVISFTPTVLEKLLAIIGPVDMTENYGVTLTADNFWLETQAIVEAKPVAGEANKPKKIIGDLLDKIVMDLPSKLDKEKLIKILSLAEESLSEKHILFYFTDEELQKEIEKRGWDGGLRQAGKDYLSLVNTNIAGGKSDKRIKEKINLVSEVMPNGSVINTLKIERSHEGIKNEPFAGVRNVNWLRIYVPSGSELLEAQGFSRPDEIYFEDPDEDWSKDPEVYREEATAKIDERSGTKIYNESGKTVFANWSMVDPGKTATIYLKYKLPFVLKEEEEKNGFTDKVKKLLNPDQKALVPYTLFAQKQAGSLGSEINTSLKLADNFKIVWKYPTGLSLEPDGWYISDKLNTDKYWAVMLEKED
ncbi:MAG: DUF4012 domain-containing protein [Patescibacteria group bacterium]|nr:DUF4012 domain-containing protein [Patescibacteria group bacterium]